MRAPSTNPITLSFGATTDPYTPSNPHKGTDFAHSPDNKIYAPFTGKVTQIPNNGNDGNGTYMTDSAGRYHGFLHASRYLVPNGSIVEEGQAIAVMGETGLAFGVHLHWAVKQNGKFIDPMSIINGGGGMPTTEEILQSALNDARKTIDVLQSALNKARHDDEVHLSALNAARAALAKEGAVLDPGKYIVKG